jgi:hypothetical protein
MPFAWLLFSLLAGASAIAGTPPCAIALAVGKEPLVDGSRFDGTRKDHALAAPLLALRALHLDGRLPTDGTPVEVLWNGRKLRAWSVSNSETGDFSPVGEHCADVEFFVQDESNGSFVSFHAFHPMVLALTGRVEVYYDLYRYSLDLAALAQVFGNK